MRIEEIYGIEKIKERLYHWCSRVQAWNIKFETGIYPLEMAFIMALCDLAEIKSVIDSGRGEHAYSTRILGEFGKETGTQIVSLDWKSADQKWYGPVLKKEYPNVKCVTGDVFNVMPRAVKGLPEPLAFIVDGPKGETANRLSYAACLKWNIKFLGHHNCPLKTTTWGKEFSSVFPDAIHYEYLDLDKDPKWQEFKKWEQDSTQGGTSGRPLEVSQLAISIMSPEEREKLADASVSAGKLSHHPAWLKLKWSLFG